MTAQPNTNTGHIINPESFVLHKLLDGWTVVINGVHYCLADDGDIAIVAGVYRSGDPFGSNPDETRLLGTDMTFKAFTRLCRQLTDDDMAAMGFTAGLRELQAERADPRDVPLRGMS